MTPSEPSVIGTLDVKATATSGGQTVTVTPKASAPNANRYKITASGSEPTVALNTVCSTSDGWTALGSDGKVTGLAGQVITVVEVDASDKAVKKGKATLPTPGE